MRHDSSHPSDEDLSPEAPAGRALTHYDNSAGLSRAGKWRLFKTGRGEVHGLPPKPQVQRRGVDGAPGIGAGLAGRVGLGGARMGGGGSLWYPTLNAKGAFRMGHPALGLDWRAERGWGGQERAGGGLWYPTLNAKGAFRMGHPALIQGRASDAQLKACCV